MVKGHRVPLLLLLLALIIRPHMAGSAYPFSQGLVLIPVLVGLALLMLNPEGTGGFSRVRIRVWVLPWVLFIWSLITLLRAPDPGQGIRESVALLGGVTVFTLACSLMSREKGFEAGAIPVLGLVVIPVLASAFYQRTFGLEKVRQTLHNMDLSGESVADLAGFLSQNRVFAGFLNPNMLAGFLAIGICITLDLLLTATGDRNRLIFYSFLTAGQAAALILTGSVGGSMAAVAMAAAVVLVRRKLTLREKAVAGMIVLVVAAGILVIRGGSFLFGPDSSLAQRGAYMAAGFRMAMVHPVLGWGAGSSPGALMGFVAEGVRPVADPHNFLIRAWISWGTPGLVLLAGFLILWIRLVIRPFAVFGRKSVPAGYAGLVFGSMAFLGHSLMDMDFFVPETALFGWCALGAAAGLALAHQEGDSKGTKVIHNKTFMIMGAVVLALVLPVFVFLQGESLAFRGGKAMAEREYAIAAKLFREARDLIPLNGRFALDEGRAHLASGDFTQAVELFEVADSLMEASPYPSWEMGRVAQQMNSWQVSIPLLEKALERYGTSPRIRIDLARGHINLGESAKGYRLLEEVRRMAIFDPQARDLADEILSSRER